MSADDRTVQELRKQRTSRSNIGRQEHKTATNGSLCLSMLVQLVWFFSARESVLSSPMPAHGCTMQKSKAGPQEDCNSVLVNPQSFGSSVSGKAGLAVSALHIRRLDWTCHRIVEQHRREDQVYQSGPGAHNSSNDVLVHLRHSSVCPYISQDQRDGLLVRHQHAWACPKRMQLIR